MSNQIEIETAEDLDHHLEMGEALERLRANPDFQKVVMEGYLGMKVNASVSLLAVPQIKKAGERTDVMEDLISASNLMFFFSMVDQFYAGAKNPVLSDDEEAEIAAAGGAH
jgi:hypothetical protein